KSGSTLSHEDVARVKMFLQENDPRNLKPGELRRTVISCRDLNLLLSYGLVQSKNRQKALGQVRFFDNQMQADITYQLPENFLGKYLNCSIFLEPKDGQLEIRRLVIGSLTIPRWVVRSILIFSDWLLRKDARYQMVNELSNSIKFVAIENEELVVHYFWRPELFRKLRSRGEAYLLTADEKERLRLYAEQLARASKPLNGQSASLIHFFVPLFNFAQQRAQKGNNPIDEHRALIFNLAAFSIGRDMSKLIGSKDGKGFPRASRVRLTLLGRNDLAKHFLVSAAITVSGGTGLANLAGVFKELDDSRYGSGFSFADLAADRAGVRFGEMASGSLQSARLLLERMTMPLDESDFMPAIENLPEGIQELAFKRTYRDLESETYREIEAEIDRRIASCRIYRQ
ncbi:MAG: hypothetical protein ONB13_02410, partial [candidate division KSB1 bacterium]|nr:hypothetical protein [candidate division KSB1 bacterium]